jgi:murein DD-endopeptidase MepM/ murein hydrolase activator NlpD
MQQRRRHRPGGLVVIVAAVLAAGLTSVAAPGMAQAATTNATVDAGGITLNVRSTPSSLGTRITALNHGTRVTVTCQTPGQYVVGKVRATNLWDRLSTGGYVSDGYIQRGNGIPRCGAPAAAVQGGVSESWLLPVPASVGSGFRTPTRPTHNGIDLSAARGTPIKAASEGTVIRVVCNASNDNCDVDGHIGAGGCGWYAEIQHAGSVVTRYCHMVQRPSVAVGQYVRSGQVIGYVGSSGNSSGPHLHFEVHVNAAPATHENATNPVTFLRTKGLNIA